MISLACCAGAGEIPKIVCETANKFDVIFILCVAGGDISTPRAILNEQKLRIRGSIMCRHEDYAQVLERITGSKVINDPLVSKQLRFEK